MRTPFTTYIDFCESNKSFFIEKSKLEAEAIIHFEHVLEVVWRFFGSDLPNFWFPGAEEGEHGEIKIYQNKIRYETSEDAQMDMHELDEYLPVKFLELSDDEITNEIYNNYIYKNKLSEALVSARTKLTSEEFEILGLNRI